VLEQALKAEDFTRAWRAFTVLGVRVDAVRISDVVAQMECWISER
jgi:hypothetical protein